VASRLVLAMRGLIAACTLMRETTCLAHHRSKSRRAIQGVALHCVLLWQGAWIRRGRSMGAHDGASVATGASMSRLMTFLSIVGVMAALYVAYRYGVF
jgi:hypothetical protein